MEPIRHELTVACDRESAFALFTSGMGSWWDPRYTPDPATYTTIDLDQRVGGPVVMRHGAATYPFGSVIAWEPSSRYAQTFWLAMDAAHPSEIGVDFAEADGVCTINFEHGGWTQANRVARAGYGHWSHLLGCFARAAARLR